MSSHTTPSPCRITLLDGALGTTLESISPRAASIVSTSPLWASDPRLEEEVGRVHEEFLRVGAEVVGSGTYQSSHSLFTSSHPHLSLEQVEAHLRRPVLIARDAILRSSSRSKGDQEGEIVEGKVRPDGMDQTGPVVGLCLGPFGATLRPGQEYGGVYPPPYGPDLTTTTAPSSSPPSEPTTQHLASLTEFHLTRLLAFIHDAHLPDSAWNSIGWICFETVPLSVEALAVRVAMGRLERVLRARHGDAEVVGEGRKVEPSGGARPWWAKRFWISFVYPTAIDGHSVDGITVSDRMEAMLSPSGGYLSHLLSSSDSADVTRLDSSERPGEGVMSGEIVLTDDLATPDGLGVNCTSPAHVGRIVREMTVAVARIRVRSSPSIEREARRGTGKSPTALVLYPDGGLVYDPRTRTWSAPTSTASSLGATLDSGESSWARNVAAIARDASQAKITLDDQNRRTESVWGEVLVGGCCKAGVEEIGDLAKELGKI